jgi:hypothetical protein
MMGTTAVVQSFERVSDEDGEGVDVKIETAGEDNVDEAEHFANVGDDAPPLKGDFAAVSEAPGAGSLRVAGYVDSKNPGKALGGEKRIYARSADGAPVAEIWLHGDGLVEITALAPGGRYKIGKVEIDQDGNIKTPGEVTAKADTPAMVTLTQHIHPTGTGPSGPATPGQ